MFHLYSSYLSTNTFLEELPLDFLGLTRFFLFDELKVVIAKKKNADLLSYSTLLKVFKAMGLIPYSDDISHLVRDLQLVTEALANYNVPKESLIEG